jgi:hypothetical protein
MLGTRAKTEHKLWVGNTQGKGVGLYGREFSPMVAIPVNPPWLLPLPVVDLEMLERLQKDREGVDLSDLFKIHSMQTYQDFVAIYTDGSKDPRTGRTGSAFVVQECGVEVRKCITDHLAVYMAELMTILLALQWVEEVKPDRVVICSDSCAVLVSSPAHVADKTCFMRCYKPMARLDRWVTDKIYLRPSSYGGGGE